MSFFFMHHVKLSHGHERDMVKSCRDYYVPTRIDRRQMAKMTRHDALTVVKQKPMVARAARRSS
jgi:hypothetical protein